MASAEYDLHRAAKKHAIKYALIFGILFGVPMALVSDEIRTLAAQYRPQISNLAERPPVAWGVIMRYNF